jgi:ketosteroid isomerase-like protein
MGSTLPSNVPQFETPRRAPRKERAPIGGIVVTVILALALIAIIAVAVTRLTSSGFSRPSPGPTAATPAAQGAPADPATQQAIQQVIQQVNDAQVQAIETKDPQVMAATATSEFYQEQVSNNQDLTDNGVTDIKLVNIEWGPIAVDGNTATATDFETWSTTFNDGTTQQSRDRNVYTLVNDNGTWKVREDAHPDQPSATPPSAP